MIILMAGFDKSGKTTLARRIEKELNFQYFKSSKQINSGVNLEEAIKHDWRFMLDFLSKVNCNIVFDRSFICQYAYSMLLRQDNIFKNFVNLDLYEECLSKYCKLLFNVHHLVVFCERQDYPKDVVDESVDMKLSFRVNYYYKEFFKQNSRYLNLIRCDFENGENNNFEKIKSCITNSSLDYII